MTLVVAFLVGSVIFTLTFMGFTINGTSVMPLIRFLMWVMVLTLGTFLIILIGLS